MNEKFPILNYFKCGHLPEHLQEVALPFATIAYSVAKLVNSSNGAEVGAGLRKLLEAKDCAVRAALSKVGA